MQLLSQKRKKIGIVGLGRTGIAAYGALNGIVEQLICYDDNVSNIDNFVKLFPCANITPINDSRWLRLDKILLSPGIPRTHNIVHIAKQNNITITSDIDLFFEELPNVDFIAVTGTNGKSTTTALISHILKLSGKSYEAGGNIGNAVFTLPLDKQGYVFELSSFQLELVSNFVAKIAVLLNITEDHLDRHLTMENYINAKKKILSQQSKQCYKIIGIDNELTKAIFESYDQDAHVIPISTFTECVNGVTVFEDAIYDNIFEAKIIKLPYIRSLQGDHNRENAAAAYAVTRLLGLVPEQIVNAMQLFAGLPHRMQYIGSKNNIDVYNDSKATNADAASKSISILNNIYWIAGGIAKSGGIKSLESLFNRITKAYLFGQDKQLFANALVGNVNFTLCENLTDALNKAFSDATHASDNNKKNILLAPAASSYDQFKNFEHRGEVFTNLVKQQLNEL